MKVPIALITILINSVVITGCVENQKTNSKDRLDIQGHRGARGLMPENSIPGFIKALDLGVTTLEMDLCVTRDKEIIISHEPYISPDYCLSPDGSVISKDSMLVNNIYQLSYDAIRQFDCGSKDHPRFPDQKKLVTYKPLLKEAFQEIERHINQNNLDPVNYNIEIKSSEKYDNQFHPTPEEFSDLVYSEIDGVIDWERINIQSFDFRVLQYFHKTYPQIQLAQLIENEIPWRENVDELGFTPDIYSCNHTLLDSKIVKEIQESGIKVIPWTVNDAERMQDLVSWGVDGIITDYPNIALELFE